MFYLQVVELHLGRYPAPESAVSDANLLFDRRGERDLPLRHDTRERLFSRAARAAWLPPDLEPLPLR